MMAEGLSSAPVAFLAAGLGADHAALVHTWQAVLATGGQPVLVSPSRGEVELWQSPDRTGTMMVDVDVADANIADFAGLVLPGGAVNADQLRASPLALNLVRGFFAAGRPVAALCRAPAVLIEAGVVAGRRLTSWPGLRSRLRSAGASWVDDRVVVCEHGSNTLITGGRRSDLPKFCQEFTRRFSGCA